MHQKLQKGGTQIVTELGNRVVLFMVLVVVFFQILPQKQHTKEQPGQIGDGTGAWVQHVNRTSMLLPPLSYQTF